MADWDALGVPNRDASSRRDVNRAAHAYARLLANVSIRDAAEKDGVPLATTLLSQRVPGAPPKATVMGNALALKWTIAGMGSLRATPISLYGAYCAGAGLASTRRLLTPNQLLAWSRSRLGALGLHLPPFAPTTWAVSESSGKDAMRDASNGQACPFCEPTAESPVADFWHVLCECKHPPVVGARTKLQHEAASFMERLCTRLDSAQRGYSLDLAVQLHAARVELHDALATHDWDTPSGASLLYRLALVLPFPAACVDDPAARAARALGSAMDATVVPVVRRHSVFDYWGGWAIPALMDITAVWAGAVDAAAAADG